MPKPQNILIQILLLLLILSCAKLPEYARPQIREESMSPEMVKQGFTYRRLTKNDFKAKSLPENLTLHKNALNARSCIRIRASQDSKFTITRNFYNGKMFYFGSIEKVTFEALMVPGCSWWNPHVSKKRLGYVLEHEQIHFALFELAARDLTRNMHKQAKTILVIKPTLHEVKQELGAEVEELVKAAMPAILAEHTQYDTETSMRFNSKKQKEWLKMVQQKLKESTYSNHPEDDAFPDEQ